MSMTKLERLLRIYNAANINNDGKWTDDDLQRISDSLASWVHVLWLDGRLSPKITVKPKKEARP
jgi:hypothetical protein